jgi:hypothetical protein
LIWFADAREESEQSWETDGSSKSNDDGYTNGGINIVSLHICSVSRRSVVSFVVYGRRGVVMAEKGKLRLPRFSVQLH